MDILHSASKVFLHSNAPNASKNGGSSASYTFKIDPLIIRNTDDSVFVIGLEGASIPLSFYAINDTNNTFRIGATTYQITDGNYSYKSLITQLNLLTGLTFGYNLDTNKLFIITVGSYTFNATVNSANNIMGFAEGDTYIQDEDFANVLNLTYTTGVQIRLDNIQTSNKSADTNGGSSLLARLPITTPAYTILQFFNPQPFYTTIKNKILNEISISLVDDSGELLILNGDPNWFITLRVDYQVPPKMIVSQTNLQIMRDEAITPLLEQQQADIEEVMTETNPQVAENTNRIQKRDLVREAIQMNIDRNQQPSQKRPLKLQKKINRKPKK
jgi:hypothetical protein